MAEVPRSAAGNRVAFIAGEYPKPSETFLLRELRELKARGLDFVVVATKRLPDVGEKGDRHPDAAKVPVTFFPDAPVILRPDYLSLRALGAEVRFALTHPLRYLGILITLYRGHWRSIEDTFRVMQNVPRALAVGYELRRLGVRRVHALWASLPATLGWIIARAFGMEFSFAAHARDVFVEGRMLRDKAALASAVVTCNRAAVARLREVVGERLARKIALLHHGIDRNRLPARAKAPGNLVVAAGRFEPKKGFDVLIRAMALLGRAGSDAHCVIAGDGPLRGQYEDLIRREAAPVELRGWMRHDDLMKLVAGAAAVAVPSVAGRDGDRDGIPNILLEAMALGVPVVATDAGSIAEVVRDGETGWLSAPGDAAAFAAKLREALADSPGKSDIITRANALIDEGFSLEKTVTALEQLLRTT